MTLQQPEQESTLTLTLNPNRYGNIFEAKDRKYVPAQFEIHQHRAQGNPQIQNGRHIDIALFKRTAPQ